ncbi:MAG: hypothetical protein ACR2P3_00985, partial [Geminicoccaceae bacterium]
MPCASDVTDGERAADRATVAACGAGWPEANDGSTRGAERDTDPQRPCVEWAEEHEIKNLDVVSHLAEDTLPELIENVDDRYDTILIDTAGCDSRMSTYIMQASDLIL